MPSRIRLFASMLVLVLFILGLSGGLGYTAMRAGLVTPPDFAFAIGPLAASGGLATDTSCPEPWVRCTFNQPQLEQRMFYAVWVIYRTGPRPNQRGHLVWHIPLARE
jgi:hypothetical protein